MTSLCKFDTKEQRTLSIYFILKEEVLSFRINCYFLSLGVVDRAVC